MSVEGPSERGAGLSQVVKQRFNPENREWENLETRQIRELDDRYRFEADTPVFSIFAKSVQETQVEEQEGGIVSNLTSSDNVGLLQV